MPTANYIFIDGQYFSLGHRKVASLRSGGPVARPDDPGATLTPPGRKNPPKPLLNALESRYRDHLKAMGYQVLEQAITLRLDPPFKSYRPDLAYVSDTKQLVFAETKGPHRHAEKGIAKVALATKCYPMFRFILAQWVNNQWKETVL